MAEKHGMEEEDGTEGVVGKRVRTEEQEENGLENAPAAKVGIWDVPNTTEREPITIEVDVNGDPSEAEAEVKRIKRERRAAAIQEIEARKATIGEGATPSEITSRSTTPPTRRARRNVGPAPGYDGSTESSQAELTPVASSSTAVSADTEALQTEIRSLRRELQSTRDVVKAGKEQAALVKQLYDDASRTAMEAEQKAQRLAKDNTGLQTALSQGLANVSKFKADRISELESLLDQANMQLKLLRRQNELTDSQVRRKAALWDEQEYEEEERRKVIEQRKVRMEAERKALQEALLGGGASTVRTTSPKPHDLFLSVNLEDEKVDVDEVAEMEEERLAALRNGVLDGARYDDIDDDDELAALQREASQFEDELTILTADVDGRRARRSRGRVAPIHSITPTIPALNPEEGQELADAMFDSQQQAHLTASNDLEDELQAFSTGQEALSSSLPPSPSFEP